MTRLERNHRRGMRRSHEASIRWAAALRTRLTKCKCYLGKKICFRQSIFGVHAMEIVPRVHLAMSRSFLAQYPLDPPSWLICMRTSSVHASFPCHRMSLIATVIASSGLRGSIGTLLIAPHSAHFLPHRSFGWLNTASFLCMTKRRSDPVRVSDSVY
jgi:hypothetical protein